ncbi:MAG: branched-chain amino acid ABC transporter permease [Thermoanaerobacteraceae bacterium]|nr:branched-chain amino acid ABC transporter permease [Thermoanaerobacteraceae bacterium]
MSLATLIQLIFQGLNMGLIYALAALGISLIWNASGLFNFSQGDLLTIGGYIMLTFFSFLSLPYPVAFLITIVIMGIAGYLLSKGYFYPMFQQNFNPQIILIGTVALSVFIRNSVLLTWGPNAKTYTNPFGSKPLALFGVNLMPHYFWNIVIVAVLVLALQMFLKGTVIGIAMRAVAQKPVAASLMGVKVGQMISLTFLLSTGLAAISGILIAPIIPLTPEMGGLLAIKAFAAALIGGLGSFGGALVGGIIIGIAEVFFATLVTSTYKDVFIFAVLIAFLMIRPGGIFRADISEKV